MKKIVIPVILWLLLVAFYFFYTSDEEGYRFEDTQERVKVDYKYKVLSQANPSLQRKQERVVVPHASLIVLLEEERNTTKETSITLLAEVINPEEGEAFNYFWREEDQLLGMGERLEQGFSKGEHHITLQVRSTQGRETNATMLVRAWDYTQVDYSYYDDTTGEFLYKTATLFDHHGNVLVEKERSSTTRYLYSEEGNKIEEQYEDYEDASNNYTHYFEYDEQGNNISTESLDAQSVMIGYEELAYDEEGYLISIKIGKDEYSLEEILSGEESLEVEEEEVDEEEESQEEENQEDEKIEYDANGNIIFYLSKSGVSQFMVEVSYNDQNQTTQKKYSSSGEGYSNSRTFQYSYDEEGELKEREEVYTENGQVVCHFNHSSVHDQYGNLMRRENHVIAGDCSDYIENIVEEYEYDKEGNILSLRSKAYDYNGSNTIETLQTTMRVNRYHTNDWLE